MQTTGILWDISKFNNDFQLRMLYNIKWWNYCEWWVGKHVERKWSLPSLTYCPSISLEKVKRVAMGFKFLLSLGQDLK
jgi:hypothetical protein